MQSIRIQKTILINNFLKISYKFINNIKDLFSMYVLSLGIISSLNVSHYKIRQILRNMAFCTSLNV